MSTGGERTQRFVNTGEGEGFNRLELLDRGAIIPPVDIPSAPNDCSSDPINTICGFEAGTLITTGNGNSFFGVRTAEINTTGTNNSLFGHQAGQIIFGGVGNAIFGANAASELKTGSQNVVLGNNSGSAWTNGVESRNILISNSGVINDIATISFSSYFLKS